MPGLFLALVGCGGKYSRHKCRGQTIILHYISNMLA